MKCKIIPTSVGIKKPSIQTWKEATYRINRIHIPIKGKMLYKDTGGVTVLDEGSIYFMINSCSQNFDMIPEYGYYHFYMDFQTVPPLLSREVLEKALAPFVEDGGRAEFNAEKTSKMITKVDFFKDKLSGCDKASERRAELCRLFDLPTDMTANALLEALNIITDYDGYREALERLDARVDSSSDAE